MEAANRSKSEAHVHEVARVCEKLRISLTQFVGADGFATLLRRSLVLARAEVSSLQAVRATADGRLEGLEALATEAGKDGEAATAITAHLLGLLVTFIGESVTLRLIRDAWPDALAVE